MNKKKPDAAGRSAAMRVIYPAMIAALLLSGQVALRVIPNVEIVTVIVIVAAFVFPPDVSMIATLVFCTGEWLIYGFGYWVVAYYFYWPLLAVVSCLLKRARKTSARAAFATLIAVIFTAFFGVLTSAVDALFAGGFTQDFFRYFAIIYLHGIWFYVPHIVSNGIIVSLLFTPLSLALKRAVGRSIRAG